MEYPDARLVPMSLIARTRKVYRVPLVRPVISWVVDPAGKLTALFKTPWLQTITLYRVIGDPPSFGAVQVTVAAVLPAVAVPIVGRPGTVAGLGVTWLEAAEPALVPAALTADTAKV